MKFKYYAHLSLKVPKMLLWKFGPLRWFGLVERDNGPPTSIGESDLDGVGLAGGGTLASRLLEEILNSNGSDLNGLSYLAPGDGVPSLLLEHD